MECIIITMYGVRRGIYIELHVHMYIIVHVRIGYVCSINYNYYYNNMYMV